MSISTFGWLGVAPGTIRCAIGSRLAVVPSKIALFRVLDRSVTASRWLRVSTWLDKFAVFSALAVFRAVEIAVVTLLGVLCDAVSARGLDPFAVRGTGIVALSVGELSVVTLLSRFQNPVTASVITGNLRAVP